MMSMKVTSTFANCRIVKNDSDAITLLRMNTFADRCSSDHDHKHDYDHDHWDDGNDGDDGDDGCSTDFPTDTPDIEPNEPWPTK